MVSITCHAGHRGSIPLRLDIAAYVGSPLGIAISSPALRYPAWLDINRAWNDSPQFIYGDLLKAWIRSWPRIPLWLSVPKGFRCVSWMRAPVCVRLIPSAPDPTMITYGGHRLSLCELAWLFADSAFHVDGSTFMHGDIVSVLFSCVMMSHCARLGL